jgi:phosphatidylglycerophosphate synthase
MHRGQVKGASWLSARIWLVQSISIFRIFAILIFASLVFSAIPRILLICLYAFAMVSDLLDGYLARKLDVATYFGKVMDLVADKSLTVISLLYAAKCGVNLLPLALIAMRDMVMIGMRLVTVEGKQLLPTNRGFGGVMASVLWTNTLVLVYAQTDELIKISNIVYWACALIFAGNLLARLYVSIPQIKTASMGNRLSETRLIDSTPECRCNREILTSKESASD